MRGAVRDMREILRKSCLRVKAVRCAPFYEEKDIRTQEKSYEGLESEVMKDELGGVMRDGKQIVREMCMRCEEGRSYDVTLGR